MSSDRTARLNAISVGDEVRLTRTIGDAEVALFTAITADVHSLQTDRTAAGRIGVPWHVVPAAYAVGLVATAMGVIAGRVPPPGAVSSRYRLGAAGWLRAGDTVTTVLTAREIRPERYEIEFSAVCRNERGEPVLSGTTTMNVL